MGTAEKLADRLIKIKRKEKITVWSVVFGYAVAMAAMCLYITYQCGYL